MDIDKVINKIFLWKKPSDFYTFEKLINICDQFYNNTCKIIFSDEYKILYQFSFQHIKNDDIDNIQVGFNGLFTFVPYDVRTQDIIFNTNKNLKELVNKNIKIYNKENFKSVLYDITLYNEVYDEFNIYKFCLLSELYQYLLNSID